jgi:hypothetical protein
MSTSRAWCVFLVLVCVGLTSTTRFSYGKQLVHMNPLPVRTASGSLMSDASGLSAPTHHSGNNSRLPEPVAVGIREEIPEKYKKRYEEWKKDFLSTQTGHQQWQAYAGSSAFLLTITIARENKNGAATGKYKWDDSGKLVAATIVLGTTLDQGYPNPIYYPVQNSLARAESSYAIDGDILAATKLAHEFGHVNRMSVTDRDRLQMELIPVYNSILLLNGYNTNDPRLVSLARRMGGTPVEIWEDREYWGEANAMLFLRDRITMETFRCALFRRIERSVQLYARNYEDRFTRIAQAASPSESCGW